MKPLKFKSILLLTTLVGSISGCNSIPFVDNTPDYKGAGRSRPLEVPPDLTSVSSSDTYSVPGSTSYSEYSKDQADQTAVQEKILPNPDNVKLERAGAQRWLVVQAPPEKIWPVIRDFWTELGFAVRVENPETGVMETEWVDASSLSKDDKGNYLDKFQGWLDKLNTLNNRQKFRTRIDRGSAAGTTEIYMSHRSVSDVPDDGKTKVRTIYGDVDTGYAPKNSDKRTKGDENRADAEDLDAELLRRLMVRLGVEEQKSKTIVANAVAEQHAVLKQDKNGSTSLTTNDAFDRAWRRVGLALDRVGFVVEDKDRSHGVYFVRYTDIAIDDAPQKKKGLLDSLKFWGDDDKKGSDPADTNATTPAADKTSDATASDQVIPEKSWADKLKFWDGSSKDKEIAAANASQAKQYLVNVDGLDAGGSIITITNKDGKPNHSATANRILSLLYEQLK